MASQTFAVRYDYVPDMESRRTPHRDGHLAFLRSAAEKGSMVLAGALTDPVDTGWLVVRADSVHEAYAMVHEEDPYAQAGLIRSITVRPIALVVPG
ncbi:MAG TPA: YciI family protein [Nocardioidaceae bacterium]|nr:YciI family protein [Nocardioidaceae bacterium]